MRPKLVYATPQSISKVVRDIIDNDLSFQDALARKYGNYSAIARIIRPRVQRALHHSVSLDSITTSVKRIKPRYELIADGVTKVLASSTINVRTDVAKLNLDKSKRVFEQSRKLLSGYEEEFLQMSASNSAVTLIFDQKLLPEIHKFFQDDDVKDEQKDLAAIIVNSPKEIIRTHGCVLAIYARIAENRINIEDTVSCFTDTIIIVRMEDAVRAFTTLTDLVNESRMKLKGRDTT
jgi:hypothetical protein